MLEGVAQQRLLQDLYGILQKNQATALGFPCDSFIKSAQKVPTALVTLRYPIDCIFQHPTMSNAAIMAAIARGKTSPIKHLSRVGEQVPSDERSILATIKRAANTPLRDYTLAHVDQFLVAYAGKICVITKPAPTTSDAGDLMWTGSLSDKIGEAVPMTGLGSRFRGHFTSLVPKAIVDKYDLPHTDQAPDTIDGPVEADGAEAQASMARLQFGVTDTPEQRPVIAALPVFLPIPKGYTVPENLDARSSDLRGQRPTLKRRMRSSIVSFISMVSLRLTATSRPVLPI